MTRDEAKRIVAEKWLSAGLGELPTEDSTLPDHGDWLEPFASFLAPSVTARSGT